MIPSSTKRGKTKFMSEVRRVATLRWGYTADRGYSGDILLGCWKCSDSLAGIGDTGVCIF